MTFRAGDKVVCVDALGGAASAILTRGATYIILAVFDAGDRASNGEVFGSEMVQVGVNYWRPHRFAKLPDQSIDAQGGEA